MLRTYVLYLQGRFSKAGKQTSMRILLVEDDKLLGPSVKRVLTKDGAAVDLITNGAQAERYAVVLKYAYDIIILDISLPGKSGIEVCADLREAHIKTPILVMSGNKESEQIVDALDKGADDYVSKPIPMLELQARVRALLRRPSDQQEPKIKHGDLVLDPSTHAVYCKGERIKLTPKEYSIMECFMRQPAQVLTRTQIIDHVWDFAFDSFSNLVDVHIKNIRKKLSKHGCVGVMRTIRGVGYKL